jgi:DNA-directed RNA polymerase subunit F
MLSNTDLVSEEYSEGVRKEAGEMSQSAQASLNIGKKFGKISKEEAESLEGGIQSQIKDVENTLANIQQLGELKSLSQELFGNIRKDLLGGVSDIAELTVAIQAKVSAQFQQMTKDGSIKALDQAQKRFESLKSVTGSTETGVNPLGGIDEGVFQEQVDASLEKKASEEIMEKVLQVSMGTNAFTRLEKALEPFLKREKIGSKEGDEARDFIARTLKEAADNLSDANEDRAKKLMISRLLIKMKS